MFNILLFAFNSECSRSYSFRVATHIYSIKYIKLLRKGQHGFKFSTKKWHRKISNLKHWWYDMRIEAKVPTPIPAFLSIIINAYTIVITVNSNEENTCLLLTCHIQRYLILDTHAVQYILINKMFLILMYWIKAVLVG